MAGNSCSRRAHNKTNLSAGSSISSVLSMAARFAATRLSTTSTSLRTSSSSRDRAYRRHAGHCERLQAPPAPRCQTMAPVMICANQHSTTAHLPEQKQVCIDVHGRPRQHEQAWCNFALNVLQVGLEQGLEDGLHATHDCLILTQLQSSHEAAVWSCVPVHTNA